MRRLDYRIFESRDGRVAVDISNMSIGDLDKALALLRKRFDVTPRCIAIGIEGNDVKRIFSWDREKRAWTVSLVEEDLPDHQPIAA